MAENTCQGKQGSLCQLGVTDNERKFNDNDVRMMSWVRRQMDDDGDDVGDVFQRVFDMKHDMSKFAYLLPQFA